MYRYLYAHNHPSKHPSKGNEVGEKSSPNSRSFESHWYEAPGGRVKKSWPLSCIKRWELKRQATLSNLGEIYKEITAMVNQPQPQIHNVPHMLGSTTWSSMVSYDIYIYTHQFVPNTSSLMAEDFGEGLHKHPVWDLQEDLGWQGEVLGGLRLTIILSHH